MLYTGFLDPSLFTRPGRLRRIPSDRDSAKRRSCSPSPLTSFLLSSGSGGVATRCDAPQGVRKEQLEVALIWPPCCTTHCGTVSLTVKLHAAPSSVRMQAPLSCAGASSPDRAVAVQADMVCNVTSSSGEKISQQQVVSGEAHFTLAAPGDGKQLQERVMVPVHGDSALPPNYSALSSFIPNLHESSPGSESNGGLSVMTVFCTTAGAPGLAGSATSVLCAPSAVAQELESLFFRVASDLMGLNRTASHLTIRDVHGFSVLLGGSAHNHVTNVARSTGSSAASSASWAAARLAYSPASRFPNSGCSLRAFELDGVFASKSASATSSPRGLPAPNVYAPLTGSLPCSTSLLVRGSGKVIGLKAGSTCDNPTAFQGQSRHFGGDRNDGQATASHAVIPPAEPRRMATKQEAGNSLSCAGTSWGSGATVPWNELDADHQSACLKTWKTFFQPLVQELGYLLTCVPKTCGLEQWDERMYIEMLQSMVDFLLHHSMWEMLNAVLCHSEALGVAVVFHGSQITCKSMQAESWCQLLAFCPFAGLDLHYKGTDSPETTMEHAQDALAGSMAIPYPASVTGPKRFVQHLVHKLSAAFCSKPGSTISSSHASAAESDAAESEAPDVDDLLATFDFIAMAANPEEEHPSPRLLPSSTLRPLLVRGAGDVGDDGNDAAFDLSVSIFSQHDICFDSADSFMELSLHDSGDDIFGGSPGEVSFSSPDGTTPCKRDHASKPEESEPIYSNNVLPWHLESTSFYSTAGVGCDGAVSSPTRLVSLEAGAARGNSTKSRGRSDASTASTAVSNQPHSAAWVCSHDSALNTSEAWSSPRAWDVGFKSSPSVERTRPCGDRRPSQNPFSETATSPSSGGSSPVHELRMASSDKRSLLPGRCPSLSSDRRSPPLESSYPLSCRSAAASAAVLMEKGGGDMVVRDFIAALLLSILASVVCVIYQNM